MGQIRPVILSKQFSYERFVGEIAENMTKSLWIFFFLIQFLQNLLNVFLYTGHLSFVFHQALLLYCRDKVMQACFLMGALAFMADRRACSYPKQTNKQNFKTKKQPPRQELSQCISYQHLAVFWGIALNI